MTMRGWYCSETGWGCGSSFQAMEEDQVVRQAAEHVRTEHGEDSDDDSLLEKIKSFIRTDVDDDTNIRAGTGKMGVAPEEGTERRTGP